MTYDTGKRVIDVAAGSLALLVCAPLIAVVALAIRLRMGPGVLFRQTRPGLHGRPFTLVKFRTMRAGAGDPALDAGTGDPALDAGRLTPLGRWLRATSLDELPSLWNVVRGEMSLVGPRPLLMRYLDRYTPEQARRHEVRPGLTGLAQVRGRNCLSWEEKFAYDVSYVDSRSPLLDLRIVAETVLRVVGRDGITAPDSATMPEFMGPGRAA
jgi:lipopolysaccharide/colanic/teichoic acid biosynthesis glycosyltransferase